MRFAICVLYDPAWQGFWPCPSLLRPVELNPSSQLWAVCLLRLPIFRLSVPNVFTPTESPGFNDEFMIGFGPEVLMPSDIGLRVHLVVLNRWGRQVFESSDYRNDWNADALDAGVYYVHVKVGDTAACKGWLHIIK